jgi:hypothetical protein
MKRVILTGLATVGIVALSAFTSVTGKVTSKKSHLTFFSHTDVEDISADNYKIAFENGKPSTNIAKTVEVSIDVFY